MAGKQITGVPLSLRSRGSTVSLPLAPALLDGLPGLRLARAAVVINDSNVSLINNISDNNCVVNHSMNNSSSNNNNK